MKNVICFSGGKDSWALLHLLEPIWPDSMVMWCNTGAAHDSTFDQMKRVQEMVPHFMEVRSDVHGFIREHGFPADMVPAWETSLAKHFVEGAQARFCSPIECCATNLWKPMHYAVMDLGATVVYRGQKNADPTKAPIKDGTVVDGVTYRFPLVNWTDGDVMAYLGERVPDYYKAGEESSRDCWLCTAYLDKNAKRIQHLPSLQRMVVTEQIRALLKRVDETRSNLVACMGGEE